MRLLGRSSVRSHAGHLLALPLSDRRGTRGALVEEKKACDREARKGNLWATRRDARVRPLRSRLVRSRSHVLMREG